jgi:hypothetical protein
MCQYDNTISLLTVRTMRSRASSMIATTRSTSAARSRGAPSDACCRRGVETIADALTCVRVAGGDAFFALTFASFLRSGFVTTRPPFPQQDGCRCA